MSSSVSGITIATFSGSSSYSTSFQQVLTRAVQLAELPIELEQNNVNDLTNQESTLTSLDTQFTTLLSSISNLGDSQGTPTATSSDTSILTASASSSALQGTYTVVVDNIGSAATATSDAGSTTITDASTQNISSSTSYTLDVNGSTYTITPSGTSLNDLVSAINAENAGVQATVVNMGGSSGADYRLSLSSTSLAKETLSLSDSGGNSLTSQVTDGAAVQYRVNGASADSTSDTRSITLGPGLTAKLLDADSSTTVTVTVGSSESNIANALSNFVSSYNTAASAVTAQTGQNGGYLTGQSIVYTMQNILSSLTAYNGGSGTVNTLAQLGITVDTTGQLSFDTSVFDTLTSDQISSFLGGTKTGGFLQTAYDGLTSLTDSTTGWFQNAINVVKDQITTDNSQISDATARVNDMQTSLVTRLTKADAAIASLESQLSYYKQLFETMNANATSSSSSG